MKTHFAAVDEARKIVDGYYEIGSYMKLLKTVKRMVVCF
jgi:hypothetical protein